MIASARRFTLASAAAAILLLHAAPAGATLQVKDDQQDDVTNKLECTDLCTVDLKFDIISTGFFLDGNPDGNAYTVTDYFNEAINLSGDQKRDILAKGGVSDGCKKLIAPGSPCTVTATFKVVDNDVDDLDQNDAAAGKPDAVWQAILNVTYRSAGAPDTDMFAGSSHKVGILDDPAPVPEPGTWLLLGLGAGFAGWAARRRGGAGRGALGAGGGG